MGSFLPGLDAHLAGFDILKLIEADVPLQLVVKNGRRSGPEWAGPCPFCGGEDRFRVWPEHHSGRGRFWCRNDTLDAHGCGASGDAIAYLRKHGRSWGDALREIGFVVDPDFVPEERTPLNPPSRGEVRAPPDVEPPSEAWQDRAETFVGWMHDLLMSAKGEKVRDYLRLRRGLREETLEAFRVGANPYDAYEAVRFWGLEEGKKVYLSMGLVLPGVNEDGRVWHLQIRRPHRRGEWTDELYEVWRRVPGWLPDKKYMSVKGGVQIMMFGLDKLRFDKPLLVCEGELDAMLAWQELNDGGSGEPLVDVVAFGGSKKVSNGLPGRWVLRMLPYERVLVAYDGDMAGVEGAKALAAQCGRAEVLETVKGRDLTDMFLAGVDLREWIGEVL